ncbi:hypothetical protein BDV12DRAFT_202922 [Aspergillus spectabilis]
MTSNEKIQLLLDKDEIRDLIYSYCQMVDRCDFDRVKELYHEDAKDDHGINESGNVADFIEELKPIYAQSTGIHHSVSNCYIKVLGDYAEAESYISAHQNMPDIDDHNAVIIAGGRYMDKFERRNNVWKFSASTLSC